MLYKDGDIVVVKVGGQLRYAKIMGVKPDRNAYLVSVDHGNGGFHIIQEENIQSLDQVNPSDVHTVDNKVPSWHGEVGPRG